MTTALRIFDGRFGRAVLKESRAGQGSHKHAEHQLIVKYDGADRRYVIDGEHAVLTRDGIMFVNAGRPHETLALTPLSTAEQIPGAYRTAVQRWML